MTVSPRVTHAYELTDSERRKLFTMSVVALVAAGIAFAVRTNILGDLAHELFHGPGGEKVGSAVGNAFLGFSISILLSSPLLDRIGMKLLLLLSSALLTFGTLGVIFVQQISGGVGGILEVLDASFLVFGLGWGLIESVINPLTATVYATDKTRKLNHLHAWWPAGLVMGSIFGFFAHGHIGWKVQVSFTLVPIIAFGLLAASLRFPSTERTAAGIADAEMWKQIANPLFIVFFLCMFLTASSELAPGQWVSFALSYAVHMQGILLLGYVSFLQFVGRHFAGPLAHRLSPIGLLWFSVVFATLGLFLLGHANTPATAMVASTVWGVGVCFMWPTMLATTSERFPKGGSLLMGLMGAAGMGAIFLVLPQLGNVYDRYATMSAHAAGYSSFDSLKSLAAQPGAPGSEINAFNSAQAVAGSHSFIALDVLPAILIFVFGAIWISDRVRGGYKIVHLDTPKSSDDGTEIKAPTL